MRSKQKPARKIVFLLTLLASLCLLPGCFNVIIVDYDELKDMMKNNKDLVIIDVRTHMEWSAGHIQDAINIRYEDFLDNSGEIIDETALTSVVPDKSTPIVTYCFGYGKADTFAEKALELGYTSVYVYSDGTADWDQQTDYYVIEYDALEAWYSASCPFDDDNVLLDVLPVAWYTGDDVAHPGGHIPGAINIWSEYFYSTTGLVNDGTALTDVVTNKNAKLIIYCGDINCGLSKNGCLGALELGYTNVYRYQGGWQEWQDKGNDLWPGSEPGDCFTIE